MAELWWLFVAVGMLVAAVLLVWRPVRVGTRGLRLAQVQRDFHLQRERLEAKFVQKAMSGELGNSARWDDCDFDDDVCYARSRNTRQLSALVAVTVAVGQQSAASPLGEFDLADDFRVGTAVFSYRSGRWDTDGQAMLNLSPAEALRYYHRDLELVGEELTGRTTAHG